MVRRRREDAESVQVSSALEQVAAKELGRSLIVVGDRRFPSVSAVGRAFGIRQETLRGRLSRGLTIEQAVLPQIHSRNIKCTLDGKDYRSLSELARGRRIPVTTLWHRLQDGLTIEEAVRPRISRRHVPCVAGGQHFPTIAAAARAHGLPKNFVNMRLSMGWTLDEALNLTPRPYKGPGGFVYKIVETATGKGYIGITSQMDPEDRWMNHILQAMTCGKELNPVGLHHAIRQNGPSAFTLEVIAMSRSEQHLSQLEVILIKEHGTLAPDGFNLRRGGGSLRSHGVTVTVDGQRYKSLREACSKRAISYPLVANRLYAANRGLASWTIDEAFAVTPRRRPDKAGNRVEVAGVIFKSLAAAYRKLKPCVSLDAVVKRVEAGWTWEQAFGVKLKIQLNHTSKSVEVCGHEYKTVKDAYEAVRPSLRIAVIYRRLKAGWSPDQAFFGHAEVERWMRNFVPDGRSFYTASELYKLYKKFERSLPKALSLAIVDWGAEMARIASEKPSENMFRRKRCATGARYYVSALDAALRSPPDGEEAGPSKRESK